MKLRNGITLNFINVDNFKKKYRVNLEIKNAGYMSDPENLEGVHSLISQMIDFDLETFYPLSLLLKDTLIYDKNSGLNSTHFSFVGSTAYVNNNDLELILGNIKTLMDTIFANNRINNEASKEGLKRMQDNIKENHSPVYENPNLALLDAINEKMYGVKNVVSRKNQMKVLPNFTIEEIDNVYKNTYLNPNNIVINFVRNSDEFTTMNEEAIIKALESYNMFDDSIAEEVKDLNEVNPTGEVKIEFDLDKYGPAAGINILQLVYTIKLDEEYDTKDLIFYNSILNDLFTNPLRQVTQQADKFSFIRGELLVPEGYEKRDHLRYTLVFAVKDEESFGEVQNAIKDNISILSEINEEFYNEVCRRGFIKLYHMDAIENVSLNLFERLIQSGKETLRYYNVANKAKYYKYEKVKDVIYKGLTSEPFVGKFIVKNPEIEKPTEEEKEAN